MDAAGRRAYASTRRSSARDRINTSRNRNDTVAMRVSWFVSRSGSNPGAEYVVDEASASAAEKTRRVGSRASEGSTPRSTPWEASWSAPARAASPLSSAASVSASQSVSGSGSGSGSEGGSGAVEADADDEGEAGRAGSSCCALSTASQRRSMAGRSEGGHSRAARSTRATCGSAVGVGDVSARGSSDGPFLRAITTTRRDARERGAARARARIDANAPRLRNSGDR